MTQAVNAYNSHLPVNRYGSEDYVSYPETNAELDNLLKLLESVGFYWEEVLIYQVLKRLQGKIPNRPKVEVIPSNLNRYAEIGHRISAIFCELDEAGQDTSHLADMLNSLDMAVKDASNNYFNLDDLLNA
jgi:hypothetical protein